MNEPLSEAEHLRLAAAELEAAGPMAIENSRSATLAALDAIDRDWARLRSLHRKAFRTLMKQHLSPCLPTAR